MASQTTTSIKLDDDLKARLKRLSHDRRRTVHWLMREAIEQYVEREEKAEEGAAHPRRPAVDHEALARAQEAQAWLAQLEAKGIVSAAKPSKWR